MEELDNLDTRISDFLQAAKPASIDLGSLVENAEDMGLARATAVAIAEADADKAADFVSLLADFLTEIDAESNGEKVADGFIAAQLLGHLGPLAAAAIPALEHCLALDGRDHEPDPLAAAVGSGGGMADNRRSCRRPGRGDGNARRPGMVVGGPRRRSSWQARPGGKTRCCRSSTPPGPRAGLHPPPCSGGSGAGLVVVPRIGGQIRR